MSYDFPQSHITPMGHQVTADLHPDDPDVVMFEHEGKPLAELYPPDTGAPERTDGKIEWRLTFTAYPSTTVLGNSPDEPPVSEALFSLGLALEE